MDTVTYRLHGYWIMLLMMRQTHTRTDRQFLAPAHTHLVIIRITPGRTITVTGRARSVTGEARRTVTGEACRTVTGEVRIIPGILTVRTLQMQTVNSGKFLGLYW